MGYYARARNLHRAAQQMVSEHNGVVPNTPEAIERLPGIGRYTSGAILSIAYGLPRPLVDANVIRVLSRLFGLRGDAKSAANQAALWSIAEQLIPEESPGDFNQGLMELGALVCDPGEPKCESCPLLRDCKAGNSADPGALPEFAAGRKPISVVHAAAIVRDGDGRFLIAQRPLHGLWGGLWEFPRVVCHPGEEPCAAAMRAAAEVAGLSVKVSGRIATVKHSVTHHRITLHAFTADPTVGSETAYANGCADVRWEATEALDGFGFSSPQNLLRNALHAHLEKKRTGALQPELDYEE